MNRLSKEQSGEYKFLPHYHTEPFVIADSDSFHAWTETLWPEVKQLFDTTWPASASRESEANITRILQQSGSGAIFLRDQQNKLIGFSMIESDMDSQTGGSYNSSVIIDPKFRGRKLMIPLLEEQMRQAALLGHTYMYGYYNANKGLMSDGRIVHQGFASRIEEHDWKNGSIVYSVPMKGPRHGDQKYIVFQLHTLHS